MGVSTKHQLNMKPFLKKILLITCFFYSESSWTNVHSFLRPRSLSQNMALQYSQFNYSLYHLYRKDTQQPFYSSQYMTFYFASTNDASLRHYFLPDNANKLRIEQNNTSDISSPQLSITRNIDAEYQSFVSIQPQRRTVGGAFGYFFGLGNFWFDVFAPVAHVQNNLNFSEQELSGQGNVPGIPNARAALNNSDWSAGKFPVQAETKNGFDDVLFRMGYDASKDIFGHHHVSPYVFVNVPTGHRSTAASIFEATMGSGGHVGAGFGINWDYWWWDYAVGQHAIFGDIRYGFWASGTECRSFDLNNGDLSRYLQVANKNNPCYALPGINQFTQCVAVEPGSTVQIILGVHSNFRNLNFEWGYNLWWRQREKITLQNNQLSDYVVFDIVGAVCGDCTSASNAKISQGVPGLQEPTSDACTKPLKSDDLNLLSGAQPVSLSSTVYTSVGADWFIGPIPNFFALAFYYEFAHYQGTIAQAGGSFKYGFRF